jgi:hypothetical protein
MSTEELLLYLSLLAQWSMLGFVASELIDGPVRKLSWLDRLILIQGGPFSLALAGVMLISTILPIRHSRPSHGPSPSVGPGCPMPRFSPPRSGQRSVPQR